MSQQPTLRGMLYGSDGSLIGRLQPSEPRDPERASGLGAIGCALLAPLPPPTHWPPRPTRMAIAIRLGITRMLLENRA